MSAEAGREWLKVQKLDERDVMETAAKP